MTGRLLPPPALVKQGEEYFLVPPRQASIRKLAALAGDLRAVQFHGEKRVFTNPPTEESKQQAVKQLQKSQRVAQFGQVATPKILRKPGQSISQRVPKIG